MERPGKLARLAAACGLACLAGAAFVAPAQANGGLPIFDTTGTGQGIVATFAVEPSIFSPLLEAGILHAESSASSQGGGQSYALGAQVFPGTVLTGFATGEVGCDGIPIATWAQAMYPETESCDGHQEVTITEPGSPPFGMDEFDPLFDPFQQVFAPITERLTVKQSTFTADAGPGKAIATVETGRFALAPDQTSPHIVSVGGLSVSTKGLADGARIGQVVTVRATDVSLLGGMLTIDKIVSRVETSSDGVTGTADARMTLVGAQVTVGGATHEATIDNEGIRVNDPALSHEQQLGVQEKVEETLIGAGVGVILATPDEIVDGARGEASIGGLVISVHGAVPNVPIPGQLAPVLGQILSQVPTTCLGDLGVPAPVCFGTGVLPGPGSIIPLMLNIASAESFSYGAPDVVWAPVPSVAIPSLDGDTVGGVISFNVPQVPEGPPIDRGADPNLQPNVVTGPLVGIVSGLPAGALLWAGMAFMVLALGMTIGPSLRHAGLG